VNGFIDSYRKEYGSSLKVMLAGGDALRLESYLKRRIFVEPQLVLYGLLSLYELNQKK
jgi:pantothenate kinase type III